MTASANAATVLAYMDAFGRTDRPAILACLTDDVEWVIPGVVHRIGKAAFNEEIQPPDAAGSPAITVARVLEAPDTVICEGDVRAGRADGSMVRIAFCDVFDMRDGLIARLTSYLMPLTEAETP